MKRFLLIYFLILLTTSSFAQLTNASAYKMPSDQNMLWLLNVKKADKDLQFKLIKERLFVEKNTTEQTINQDVPLLIIDGIIISPPINQENFDFLNSQLNSDKVAILIVEKEPEGLYVNKAFTGIVLLTINDKKLRKKFSKLKFNP